MRAADRPDLRRLARMLWTTDSFTAALAAWTGTPVRVDLHAAATVVPGGTVLVDLRLPAGTALLRRDVVMLGADGVRLAVARSFVHLDSPLLTAPVRTRLAAGESLGEALRPLGRRRVPVSVTPARDGAVGRAERVLDCTARLDVDGTPVAWVDEAVLGAAVLAHRGLPPVPAPFLDRPR